MTREEAKSWLRKLYARADITDEYGDMEDMQPYEEAINMAITALSENKGEDRPKGHWIYLNGVWPYRWECDQCGSLSKLNFNFCPDCGVDMRGE